MKMSQCLFRHRLPIAAGLATAVGVLYWLPVALGAAAPDENPPAAASGYAKWQNGPGKDAAFFPIAVWLQDPRNAPKYQALGVNLYVALWEGPTAEQIAELKRHGMPVICDQNEYALKHLDEKTIVGWMHGDEPDNAQSLGKGKGYGPPIPPEKIIEDYRKIKEQGPDPAGDAQSRPGRGLGRLVRPRRADQSSRGLRPVRPGRRHRLLRHLPGRPRQARRRREALVCGPGRRAAAGLGGRRPDRVELHRMYADQQHEDQAHAPAGEGRGVDVDHPRLAGDHLLLPPVPAPVHRGGALGRRGDGPSRGRDQPGGPGPGRGHQQPFASPRPPR